MIFTIS